ncbi:MAG: hypothetical protein IPK82_29000 [Polyangiaceae bacterium]|nr:hypothetical protein [Polyangiaceae bacterium]
MTQRKDPIEKILTRRKACPEAVVWARQFDTLEEVWQSLAAPDWALWALSAFGYQSDRKLRQFAVLCAQRCKALWPDPACDKALSIAEKAAAGLVADAELTAAYRDAHAAANTVAERTDFSESLAAASAAVVAALRTHAMDAAMGASRESSRAIAWDPSSDNSWDEEGVWQSNELRRIVGGDVHTLIADVRRTTRNVLPIV